MEQTTTQSIGTISINLIPNESEEYIKQLCAKAASIPGETTEAIRQYILLLRKITFKLEEVSYLCDAQTCVILPTLPTKIDLTAPLDVIEKIKKPHQRSEPISKITYCTYEDDGEE